MDREAAVIREEMTHTRAALDRKIALLEDRARELTPRNYWERNKPDFFLDRVLGGVLTLAGLAMAANMARGRRDRRHHMRRTLASYGYR